MAQYGTTKKQREQAINRLKNAGMKAWPTAAGNHSVWVANASSQDTAHCVRITVPHVDAFIQKFAAAKETA